MCDFDLDAIIFGAPEHSQPLAELFENFDPTSSQEELQVQTVTQLVDTYRSPFFHSTPEPVAQVGEYQLPLPPNPLPWASLIDTCCSARHHRMRKSASTSCNFLRRRCLGFRSLWLRCLGFRSPTQGSTSDLPPVRRM